MNKIHLIFRLIKTIIEINKFNNVGSDYHRQAKVLVNQLTAPYNLEDIPNIPTNTKLKMQWYMAEVLYVCENFNELIGQHSTSKQRKTYLISGALGAMCDLIIDDIEMDLDRIKSLKRPGSNFTPIDRIEELYVACYQLFVDSLDNDVKKRTLHYYELVFDAQVRSKQQFNPNLTREEADEICKEKCGYSFLFLRAMVKGEMDNTEKDAWFELGAFIQYCNDAQDLHKDLAKKMRTFATTRPDLDTIARGIDKQRAKAFSIAKKTRFKKEKKDDFLLALHVMNIAILSKLHAFQRMCNYNFCFEKFSSKSKGEVRSALTPVRLFRYWFPKVITYQYKNVEEPYPFEYNLTNSNISTTKNKQHYNG